MCLLWHNRWRAFTISCILDVDASKDIPVRADVHDIRLLLARKNL